MKKIVSLLVILVIVVAGVILVPKLIHKCDSCETTFVGTGYEANVITDVITDTDQIICKDCAEEQHAISIFAGKSLDDFKVPLFE